MVKVGSYEKIKAWQKAHLLALEVYLATRTFPKEEVFGLTSQLRRAAISIPTNIVEGYARQNQKVFGTFLDTAYASLVEVKYLLQFSFEIGYLGKSDFTRLESLADEVGKVLWVYMKEVKSDSRKQKAESP
ncbi:MAG: hypothetical protein A2126_04360 [Candidatus Woykebacteria bacterium GWB1_45_5]|uniref:Four helix bundle protein n=2 Tax=Candidatus Woykeibacteriota TaxID=1817899 RepID=A0A1G1W477_9BACT|nr:MAG: hypothetical protein A2126_04360 [Candidatus Woykebacteria bacterium GWB1_45_5]OGY22465.1 MAG: hypothetical protein A2113_01650 [Candidatus Woykebacteria bacterium GWA1_44_8]